MIRADIVISQNEDQNCSAHETPVFNLDVHVRAQYTWEDEGATQDLRKAVRAFRDYVDAKNPAPADEVLVAFSRLSPDQKRYVQSVLGQVGGSADKPAVEDLEATLGRLERANRNGDQFASKLRIRSAPVDAVSMAQPPVQDSRPQPVQDECRVPYTERVYKAVSNEGDQTGLDNLVSHQY